MVGRMSLKKADYSLSFKA